MRIKRFVNELCILKHRASCSKNEERAAKHIFELMGLSGVPAVIEEFKSQKSLTGELVIILLFFLTAIVSSFRSPWLGWIIGMVGAVLFWGYFSNRFKPVARLFRTSVSRNVVGRIRNEAATHKIIFTAHHDSARSSLLWHPKVVGNFRSSFLTGVGVLILLLIFLLLSAIHISGLWLNVLILFAGLYLLGQIIILLHGRFYGKLVQGASDNASGVAAMLDIAAQLKNTSFPYFEFWFVSTGSEEVGSVGMTHFLKTYQEDFSKSKTFFINIDNVGSGQLHYYTGEGMLNFYKFSRLLIAAANEASRKKGFTDITPAQYRIAYTDSIIPASQGYQCILLLATDERGGIPNWHWETDTVANVNFDLIQQTSDFLLEMTKCLDEKIPHSEKELLFTS